MGILTSGDVTMAKGKSNFGNKKAAPFVAGGKRKKSSTKTAKGTKKK